jgi:hypothetical protein
MLLRDKWDHLRPPANAHPMHSKNIFDAGYAYRARRPAGLDLDLKDIKM